MSNKCYKPYLKPGVQYFLLWFNWAYAQRKLNGKLKKVNVLLKRFSLRLPYHRTIVKGWRSNQP